MSREDGFAVMDVSTDICNDPKFRRLQRESPAAVAVGVFAYFAIMGESWKAGRRVAAVDAWPALVPFDPAIVEAMVSAGLLDRRGLLPQKAWDSWYRPAAERRAKSRDRWARYNAKRDADTALPPRGNDAATATSAPSVPSVRPSDPSAPTEETRDLPPPPAERGRRSNGTNPRANGHEPRARSTNPRANGTSTRQVRSDQKRGKTNLGDVLRGALAGEGS